MPDILEVGIDSGGAERGANAYAESVNRMTKASTAGDVSQKRLDKSLRRTSGSYRSTATGADQAAAATRRAAKQSKILNAVNSQLAYSAKRLITVYAAFRIFRDYTNTVVEYGRALGELRGVTGATTAEMLRLEAVTRQLGATTPFSAKQAAEGAIYLARAGFTVQQSIEALPATLDLALAATLDLGRAADIASNVMATFAIDTKDARRAVDVLAKTANSSNTNVEQLAHAIKFAGAVMGPAGKSLEETSAAIGVLSNRGIQASFAGTTLRGVTLALLNPTLKARKTFAELGVTLDDMDPVANSLSSVFKKLGDAGLDGAQAAAIFRRRMAGGALILSQNTEELDKLTAKTRDATGETQRMADVMGNTLWGSLKALRSAIEEMYLAIDRSGVGDAMREVVDFTTDLVRSLAGVEKAGVEISSAAKVAAKGLKLLVQVFVFNRLVKLSKILLPVVNGLKGVGAAAITARKALGLTWPMIVRVNRLLNTLAAGGLAAVAASAVMFTKRIMDAKDAIKSFSSVVSVDEATTMEEKIAAAQKQYDALRDLAGSPLVKFNFLASRRVFNQIDEAREQLHTFRMTNIDAINSLKSLAQQSSPAGELAKHMLKLGASFENLNLAMPTTVDNYEDLAEEHNVSINLLRKHVEVNTALTETQKANVRWTLKQIHAERRRAALEASAIKLARDRATALSELSKAAEKSSEGQAKSRLASAKQLLGIEDTSTTVSHPDVARNRLLEDLYKQEAKLREAIDELKNADSRLIENMGEGKILENIKQLKIQWKAVLVQISDVNDAYDAFVEKQKRAEAEKLAKDEAERQAARVRRQKELNKQLEDTADWYKRLSDMRASLTDTGVAGRIIKQRDAQRSNLEQLFADRPVLTSVSSGRKEEMSGAIDQRAQGEAYRALEDQFRLHVQTRQEILTDQYETQLEMLSEFNNANLVSDQAAQTRRLELQQAYADRMRQITEQQADEERRIELQKWQARFTMAQQWTSTIQNLLVAFGNKSLAENKGFAIAQVAISTAIGIAKALELGFPAAIPAMALATSTGLAQVAAITSAQKGSASIGGTAVSTATPAAPAAAGEGRAPRQAPTVFNVSFAGNSGQDELIEFANMINKATDENLVINVPTRST